MRIRGSHAALCVTSACVLVTGSAWAGGVSTESSLPRLEAAQQGTMAPLPTISPPPPVTLGGRTPLAVVPALPTEAQPPPDSELVVSVRTPGDLAGVAEDHRLRVIYSVPELPALQIRTPPESRTLSALRADPRVRFVENVEERRRMRTRRDPLTFLVDPSTGWPYQWTFRHTRVDQALNLSRGSPSVTVGVLDSGYTEVPDLIGKIAGLWYFSAQTNTTDDFDGHGTLIASIIASTNDDSFGLAGTCGECRLIVFKDLLHTSVTTAAAIRRLTDLGVRIINLSFGGYAPSHLEAEAIWYSIERGVLLVGVAGNDALGLVMYPAAAFASDNGAPSWGLAVGASDASDRRAPFSNWGARLSLVAPGALHPDDCRFGAFGALPPIALGVEGLCGLQLVGESGARYAYVRGTSFAVPQVAGVAALLWAARPELRNFEVAGQLMSSAERPGHEWSADIGWGVLDAAAALESATGRSSVDRIDILDVHQAQRPRAGRVFTLHGVALWGDDGAAVSQGTVTCAARIGSSRLRVVAGEIGSAGFRCSWRLPANAGGRRVIVRIVVEADGVAAERRFNIGVPRVRR